MPKPRAKREKVPIEPEKVDAVDAKGTEDSTEVEALEVPRNGSRKAAPGQYLTFLLGGEEYAAEILKVREILEYDTLTRVPMTAPWVRGVLNLRGAVVPVADMAVKFGLPETEITKLTCVVIVEIELQGETTVLGVMVDAVSRVMDLSADQIEPPPAFGTRVHTDYLLGVATLGERLIMILDIDRILAAEELTEVAAIDDASEDIQRREGAAGVPEVGAQAVESGSGGAAADSQSGA